MEAIFGWRHEHNDYRLVRLEDGSCYFQRWHVDGWVFCEIKGGSRVMAGLALVLQE
jgi:hypothetical protein